MLAIDVTTTTNLGRLLNSGSGALHFLHLVKRNH
jgi:hypothetical protein